MMGAMRGEFWQCINTTLGAGASQGGVGPWGGLAGTAASWLPKGAREGVVGGMSYTQFVGVGP